MIWCVTRGYHVAYVPAIDSTAGSSTILNMLELVPSFVLMRMRRCHYRLIRHSMPAFRATPAATTLPLQSTPTTPHHRRTFWCLVKCHHMRMLRQPQRCLLLQNMLPVPMHHAGAKHMFTAAGGNQRAQFLLGLQLRQTVQIQNNSGE